MAVQWCSNTVGWTVSVQAVRQDPMRGVAIRNGRKVQWDDWLHVDGAELPPPPKQLICRQPTSGTSNTLWRGANRASGPTYCSDFLCAKRERQCESLEISGQMATVLEQNGNYYYSMQGRSHGTLNKCSPEIKKDFIVCSPKIDWHRMELWKITQCFSALWAFLANITCTQVDSLEGPLSKKKDQMVHKTESQDKIQRTKGQLAGPYVFLRSHIKPDIFVKCTRAMILNL